MKKPVKAIRRVKMIAGTWLCISGALGAILPIIAILANPEEFGDDFIGSIATAIIMGALVIFCGYKLYKSGYRMSLPKEEPDEVEGLPTPEKPRKAKRQIRPGRVFFYLLGMFVAIPIIIAIFDGAGERASESAPPHSNREPVIQQNEKPVNDTGSEASRSTPEPREIPDYFIADMSPHADADDIEIIVFIPGLYDESDIELIATTIYEDEKLNDRDHVSIQFYLPGMDTYLLEMDTYAAAYAKAMWIPSSGVSDVRVTAENLETNPHIEGDLEFAYQAEIVAAALIQARNERIASQFNPFTGEHFNLVDRVRRSMNDPSSYRHVETGYRDDLDTLYVVMTFRGTNAFGAMVIQGVEATIDAYSGEVLEMTFLR